MARTLRNGAVEARPYLESLVGPITFGRMLRAFGMGEGMTQEALAERLGVPKQNLSAIENNRRSVSVERAAAWAKELGYGEAQFVRLALQAELDAAGIRLEVSVAPAKVSPRRSRKTKAA